MYYFRCPCKKSAGNYFPNARLPPLPFMAKTQLQAYRRKVKINRGLVETLRNFGDNLNVLFYISMQKLSRKLFSYGAFASASVFGKNVIARVPSESKNKLRAFRNVMKIWRHSQCIILDVQERNKHEIVFLMHVCHRFCFWQKRN